MKIYDLPIHALEEAKWNSNVMEEDEKKKLSKSIYRFGLVQNLVARQIGNGKYEILSGNQRLKTLREQGETYVPCFVVDLDEAGAMLLAQTLNRLHGEDDLGLRAELIRTIADKIPQADILSLLPETAESLSSLSNLGMQDLAEQLEAWKAAQAVRLRHMTIQLSDDQLGVVEEALSRVSSISEVEPSNPNKRGNALYVLCRTYLEANS